MALSPLCCTMQIAAAVSGNLTRLQAPFSARNSQLAKSNRRPTVKSARCSAADPASTDNNPSLLDEFQNGHKPYRRFPRDFSFGAASSAFQVEGATNTGGKGPSIWDTFCEKYPGKIAGGANGNPAAGSYERYQDDVDLMYEIGLNAYRFSISWARVLPDGKRNKPNEVGIAYYNRLIDALIAKGIKPYVTLFHWDVPQALEDEYGGVLSRKIIKDYIGFAELCFQRFGDRVKHWITMNEPQTFANVGYVYGSLAPGHCTPDLKLGDVVRSCPAGDSLREPYKVAHNILLAHSEAVKLYRDHYQTQQHGKVGMSLNCHWFEPDDNTALDREAQNRAFEFNFGWFMDPVKFGKYPFSMRALVGDRLENFTAEESEKLKDSFDFIGLNYYTARYAKDVPFDYTHKPVTSIDDMFVDLRVDGRYGPIGPAQPNSWVIVYPDGLHKLLVYIKDRYGNPPIYITENGVERRDGIQPLRPVEELNNVDIFPILDDCFRIDYLSSHIDSLGIALRSQVDLRGYFVWSLLDSFEWSYGYTAHFGLLHVDRKTLERRLKHSACWLREILHPRHVPIRPPPPSELANNILPRVSSVINKNELPAPVPAPAVEVVA